MRQKNHRSAVGDLGKRTRQIVNAAKTAATLFTAVNKCELITKACNPKCGTILFKAHSVVFKNRDADVLQRSLAEDRPFAGFLGRSILPPIVITEDGVNAEPSPEDHQRLRPFARFNPACDPAMPGRVVAEENN